MTYKRILVTVELNPESDSLILKKAQEFKEKHQSDVFLLHVVESMVNYGAAYGIVVGIDIEETLQNEAAKSLKEIGSKLGIPENRQIIAVGSPGRTILEEAENKQANLIIMGSHGRHGVRLLLGSTANAVLHGAKCDVLAVRLQDE